MPWSNFSSSQKSSADKKVKVAGPSNQHCHSSYTIIKIRKNASNVKSFEKCIKSQNIPKNLEIYFTIPEKYSKVRKIIWKSGKIRLRPIEKNDLTNLLTILTFFTVSENFDNSDNFDNLWQLWEFMTILAILWQFLTIHDHFGGFWQFLTIWQ